MRIIRLMASLAFAASAATAVACGQADSSAVGIVVAIEPADGAPTADVTAFTLQTGDGRTLGFEVGEVEVDGTAFEAYHLREHLATAQPIAVAYRQEEGRRVANRLVDAPWFTP